MTAALEQEVADLKRRNKAWAHEVELLRDAVMDLCWKATPVGETADGDVHAYILPKGTVHRLIGAAQSAGIPAAFRAIPNPSAQGDQ